MNDGSVKVFEKAFHTIEMILESLRISPKSIDLHTFESEIL